MAELIKPHGGVLKNLYLSSEKVDAEKRKALDYPSWDLTPRQACDIELLLNLSRVLEAGGEAEEALATLDAALENTGGAVALLIQRGALLARLGRYAEAETDLQSAIATAPDALEAHLQLGVSHLRRGRHSEARWYGRPPCGRKARGRAISSPARSR